MRGVGVAEPVDQVRALLEGLAELLARRRHPRLGLLAGGDEVEQPGLLADARVDVAGEAVADHRVDHEQDVGRAGQPPAPERLDRQPAAEVVAQPPERPQRGGGEVDASVRLRVGLEEEVLVGVGVVDDVPGCEPGLALADDLQALDAIGVGDLAEPAADRPGHALGLGLGGEDQVVEVAARWPDPGNSAAGLGGRGRRQPAGTGSPGRRVGRAPPGRSRGTVRPGRRAGRTVGKAEEPTDQVNSRARPGSSTRIRQTT